MAEFKKPEYEAPILCDERTCFKPTRLASDDDQVTYETYDSESGVWRELPKPVTEEEKDGWV